MKLNLLLVCLFVMFVSFICYAGVKISHDQTIKDYEQALVYAIADWRQNEPKKVGVFRLVKKNNDVYIFVESD